MANQAIIGAVERRLELFDYPPPLAGSSPPAGVDGLCVVRFRVDPAGGVIYLIDRITVYNTSTTATVATVYVGDPSPGNIADTTYEGNRDVADEVQPISVVGEDTITVVWEGASVGAVGTARLQYRKARMVG